MLVSGFSCQFSRRLNCYNYFAVWRLLLSIISRSAAKNREMFFLAV
ncbi:hypothetical protein CLOSTASPAR_06058, partial [[Clostridium] asparagiforme DSM 15981]